MQKDLRQRLGTKGDFKEISKHPWFANINWKQLEKRKLKAPYQPDVKEADNFEFFDSEFTSEGFDYCFFKSDFMIYRGEKLVGAKKPAIDDRGLSG